ncbi:MAG: hypothetical protein FWE20_10115 [Defluviitaleaceae bacterium]|nr:hypothetical protein [Defluviitaleaceae bacterium]
MSAIDQCSDPGVEHDVRVFFAAVEDSGDSGFQGSLHQIDPDSLKRNIDELSYGTTLIDAEFKDGTNQVYSIDEWQALGQSVRERIAGTISRNDPINEEMVDGFLATLRGDCKQSGKSVTKDAFLADFNNGFMDRAKHCQPDMLRVAREAASEMLARGDAEVFRLMSDGPHKLSPIDAVKTKGLWFTECRDFAIDRGSLAGLEKWAERTAGNFARQAEKSLDRGEHMKLHRDSL